ncbi:MAG: hypothetical protein J1E34_02570 [Oscillospiraceae bacterium]|nr:hypothetical protein [Oscillospiraceae bacterium]
MTLAFPNLGKLSVLLSAYMREVGGSFASPLPTTEKTVKLGVKYAPPDACLPMKVVLGNFLESYENGADTALFLGGRGPCSFGYFAEAFRLIFKQSGIKMEVIAPEYDLSGIRDVKNMLRCATKTSLKKQVFLIPEGIKCAGILDEYEQALCDKRAELINNYKIKELEAFEEEINKKMQASPSLTSLMQTAKNAIDEINCVKADRTPPLKIGIAGDIYTIIDPFMNKNIQKLLGSMGAYTRCSMSISTWLRDKLKINGGNRENAAADFLPHKIGGFAKETVENAASWAKEGFDGIIELYPLNCMPESVARNILPEVSKRYKKPVLSIVMDEQSAEAGFITRLEAFTQMIERRKNA